MTFFAKLFEALFMAESSPQAMRNWRNIVGVVMLSLCVFAAWAVGSVEKLGMPGFATSTQVDVKLVAAIKPIQDEQVKQGSVLALVSEQVRESLSESKASELRALALKRCKDKEESDREATNREIDRKQAEYFRLLSRYYSVPVCGDL